MNAQSLEALTASAGGLLPAETYQTLFRVVAERKPGVIVEIGTAHGASAIAMALGAKSVGATTKLITVDPLEGPNSSRSKFGDKHANAAIVQANFERAGVDDIIELFVGFSNAFAESPDAPERIDMLVIDADGRFDRDLALFQGAVHEGTMVVIDDIEGDIKLSVVGEAGYLVDLKHVLSRLLLARLCEAGLLNEVERSGATAFCEVQSLDRWRDGTLERLAIECYRELVYTPVEPKTLSTWAMRDSAHADEVLLGRRALRWFGGAIRTARKAKAIVKPASGGQTTTAPKTS